PLELTDEWIDQLKKEIPELPGERRRRFIEEYGLPEYDAGVITAERDLADFFEEGVECFNDPKTVSNWVMGEFLRLLKEEEQEVKELNFNGTYLGELLKLIDDGIISSKIAKNVFKEMFKTGKKAETIVEEKGLKQISDQGQLEEIISRVIKENPDPVEDYKSGKEKAIGFLVGQVMKETRGKANPRLVNKLLREKLDSI
ncbi:MAG TPA: Asp-tRNA(Asn)/Glu-tRNA(Gln) amidotransferase GatCAB subunit B, partial [Halanaerobiales bacterium]|nr:Asp-tRNA(Asn)/Glu-tRNA(Gln) amidotransferase GatCAB subunit B [Halanaerobiales bacterium]